MLDRNRKVPNFKNRVAIEIEQAVIDYALKEPAHDQAKTSNEIT